MRTIKQTNAYEAEVRREFNSHRQRRGLNLYQVMLTCRETGVVETVKVYAKDSYTANLYAQRTFMEDYYVYLLGRMGEIDATE